MAKVTKLEMKGSRILPTLVQPMNEKCLMNACLTIKVQNSANMLAQDSDELEMKLESSELIDSLLLTECTDKVTVIVNMSKSACVIGATKLKMGMGSQLMNVFFHLAKKAEESRFMFEIGSNATLRLTSELEMKGKILIFKPLTS